MLLDPSSRVTISERSILPLEMQVVSLPRNHISHAAGRVFDIAIIPGDNFTRLGVHPRPQIHLDDLGIFTVCLQLGKFGHPQNGIPSFGRS